LDNSRRSALFLESSSPSESSVSVLSFVLPLQVRHMFFLADRGEQLRIAELRETLVLEIQ